MCILAEDPGHPHCVPVQRTVLLQLQLISLVAAQAIQTKHMHSACPPFLAQISQRTIAHTCAV